MTVRVDRVGQTTATTGTGVITLAGVINGYQAFSALADGDVCKFVIEDLVNNDFEVVQGTYTAAGTTLSRTRVISSTNAGALVNFAAGTKQVYLVLAAEDAPDVAHGQCRLSYVSTTSIKLSPHNGNAITISGRQYEIPSAGKTLPNTGLAAATLYYIYLYDNAGALTLEASATGHSTDTTAGNVGVEIKTGDATRTLVGMVYMDAGSPGLFADSAQKRWVISWFNRQAKSLISGTYTTSFSNTYPSTEKVTSNRTQFISWGEDIVAVAAGYLTNTTAANGTFSEIFGGAVSPVLIGTTSFHNPSAGTFNSTMASVAAITVAEGLYKLGVGAHVLSSSTGSINAVKVVSTLQG